MKKRKTTEDYLKTIYTCSDVQPVKACRIAEKLRVSKPTVSVALKQLQEEGYLDVQRGKVVRLTEQGLSIARATYERHRVLRELLVSLGVDPEIADRDACEMEHSVGPESFEALRALHKSRKAEASGG